MEKLTRHIIKKTSISDMDDDGYVPGTPEYRIGIVWDITRDTWSFVKKEDAERRLQRDVTNIIRGGG
ncbi:MAG TPA: hypothetical protein ENN21_07355 [Spirochaetes bacterium]|nr:hypothetical protein [Spirochaetota bacterium]